MLNESSKDIIDPETLAALLDGTLSADERSRVLATLARSDESHEDFLEAAALLKELNGDSEGEPLTSPPIDLRLSLRRTPATWRRYALAAGIPALAAAGIVSIVIASKDR